MTYCVTLSGQRIHISDPDHDRTLCRQVIYQIIGEKEEEDRRRVCKKCEMEENRC